MSDYRYKAFISYSHAADGKLAPAVHSAVQQFAKPWFRLRNFRVFRDKTSLSATPGLWPTIVKSLSQSEWFLLMASPQSAASEWVSREIAWWLENRSSDRILVLLTDGELTWDENTRRFDTERSSAVSGLLEGAFEAEPLYVDLRWARSEERLSLRDPAFRSAILDVAAPLHGKAKEDLDGQDVREHRKTRRLAASAITLLALLTVGMSIAAYLAVQNSMRAEAQLRVAQSRQLAAQARLLMDQRHDLALLLAVEATRTHPTYEARDALLAGLLRFPAVRKHLRTAHTTVSSGSYRHEPDRVTGLTFRPDSRQLAVRTWAGGYELYDAASGRMIGEPLAEPGDYEFRAIGPDLDVVAAQAPEGIVLWSVATRSVIGVFEGSAGFEGKLAFSPDGSRLASGTDDGIVRLWDVASLQALGPPLTESNRAGGNGSIEVVRPIDVLRFNRDGSVLTARAFGGTYRHFDVASLRDVTEEPGNRYSRGGILNADESIRVTITGDGRLVRTRLDDPEAEEVELLGRSHPRWGSVRDIAAHPDGRMFAASTSRGLLLTWYFFAGSPERPNIVTGLGETTDLAYSPDGRMLAGATDDGKVVFWGTDKRPVIRHDVAGIDRGTGAMAFSHDGRRLVMAAETVEQDDWPEFLSWDLDAEAVAPERLRHDECYPQSLAFSPDDTLLVAGCRGERVLAWDLRADPPTARLGRADRQRGRPFVSIAFDPAGRRFATGTADRGIFLWDAVELRQLGEPLVDSESDLGDVTTLAFGPGGRRLYAGSNFVETVWDLQQRVAVPDFLEGHRGRSRAVALSADGRLLAGSSADGILLWTLPGGESAGQVLNLHSKDPDQDVATWMAFGADAQMLAWASEQGDLILWDTAARQMLGAPLRVGSRGRTEMTQGHAMSPDGRWLASTHPDGISLWDLSLDSWQRRACEVANRSLTPEEWEYYLAGRAYRDSCE